MSMFEGQHACPCPGTGKSTSVWHDQYADRPESHIRRSSDRGHQMVLVYEFEIFEDNGSWLALPFDFEGGTMGDNFQDAIAQAADWLHEMGNYSLTDGVSLPRPTFGNTPRHNGHVIAVSAVYGLDTVPSVTAAQAARELGVSRARVSQMCAAGLLTSWKQGPNTMVSRASIEARKLEAPGPGRPRKLVQEGGAPQQLPAVARA